MMICRIPVLFQLLLVIVHSFSPLTGMEREQIQQQVLPPQQALVQKDSLFESITCVPFEAWKKVIPIKPALIR